MDERFLVLPLMWAIAVAYVAIRRRPSPENLLLIASGSAITLIAFILVPDRWVAISVALLGWTLFVRGADSARRREREREATTSAPES